MVCRRGTVHPTGGHRRSEPGDAIRENAGNFSEFSGDQQGHIL